MLADRLRKRGVLLALTAVLAMAREVGAEVSPGALTAVARIGRTVPAGAVPAAAALLTRAVRAMTTPKFTLIAVALTAALVGLWAASGPASDPPPPQARPAAQPAKAAPREFLCLAWRKGFPVLLDTNGKVVKELPNGTFADKVGGGVLSPDGKRVAYSVEVEVVRPSPRHVGLYRQQVYLRDLDDPEAGTDLNLDGQVILWSRDGRLYGVTHDWDKVREGKEFLESITWVYDFAMKTKTTLDLPKDMTIADESPDGKQLLVVRIFMDGNTAKTQTYLSSPDGKKRTVLLDTDCEYRGAKFSPDGSKILLANHSYKNNAPSVDHQLAVYDVTTKKITPLKIEGLPKYHGIPVGAYAWHPDGKRIYFAWHEVLDPALLPPGILPGVPAPGAKQPPPVIPPPVDPKNPPPALPLNKVVAFPEGISVVNSDGSGMKVIYTETKHRLGRLDWR
jgi:Tol biopolymer transport system component